MVKSKLYTLVETKGITDVSDSNNITIISLYCRKVTKVGRNSVRGLFAVSEQFI